MTEHLRLIARQLGHLYEADADRLTQLFTEIVKSTPELFDCHQRLLEF